MTEAERAYRARVSSMRLTLHSIEIELGSIDGMTHSERASALARVLVRLGLVVSNAQSLREESADEIAPEHVAGPVGRVMSDLGAVHQMSGDNK